MRITGFRPGEVRSALPVSANSAADRTPQTQRLTDNRRDKQRASGAFTLLFGLNFIRLSGLFILCANKYPARSRRSRPLDPLTADTSLRSPRRSARSEERRVGKECSFR